MLRWFKLLAAVLVGLLLAGGTIAGVASAQRFPEEEKPCEEFNEDAEEEEADTAACLEQEGDNIAESNNDFEGTGGDGVAGSNVIGAAGTGDTDITANNNSRFANAEGGNVEANSNTQIDNGPELTVEGGNVTVTSIATGISTVSQVATPSITIDLEQLSSSTGTPTFANSVSGLTTITGTNSLGQSIVSPTSAAGASGVTGTGTGAVSGTSSSFTGIGPVTQTLNQTGSTTIDNTFAPIVTTTATNTANVTGSAPVNQTGSASTNPTATAFAGPNTTRAFLSQVGDNIVDANFDAVGVGGDGVAGSNIIGVAGAGDTSISADNVSEFADGEGGSTDFNSDLVVDNGPDLTVTGGNTTVLADALGIATVNQTAAPEILLELEQTANATGPSTVTNTVSAATNITGTNLLNQTITGAGAVTPTGTGAGGVTPTGSSFVTTTIGAVNQTINQDGSSAVTNTFAPVINTSATNAANVTGSSPVTQSGTATTDPTAIAEAGPNTTRAALVQASDNIFESNVDGEGIGGDGIAGSNVIGVAGAGRTTIDASNDSKFADGQGGDTIFEQTTTADNGPDLLVEGGNVRVTAIATGIAEVFQTATPSITIDLDQTANATGPSLVSNTVSAATSLSGTNILTQSISGGSVVTGTGGVTSTSTTSIGPVNQLVSQTASSTVNNTFTPTITTTTSNTATLSGSSPVNQTATTSSNPTSIAIAP